MGVGDPDRSLIPKLVQKPIGPMGTSYGCRNGGRRARGARSACNRGGEANPRERGSRELAQEYRDGTATAASAERRAKKTVAYSQIDTGARTSDLAQPNVCPTPD
jgi:hypothetical protein